MKTDAFTKLLLATIALFLGMIALRPYLAPEITHAQGPDAFQFYIEPGVHWLRAPDGSAQLRGKVVVDLTNGNIWGFPTLSGSEPYPIDNTKSTPPISSPMYLGKFNFSRMDADPPVKK